MALGRRHGCLQAEKESKKVGPGIRRVQTLDLH